MRLITWLLTSRVRGGSIRLKQLLTITLVVKLVQVVKFVSLVVNLQPIEKFIKVVNSRAFHDAG